MLDVTVSVLQNGKEVPLAKARDPKVRAALGGIGTELGKKLEPVVCPEHGRGVQKVRVTVGPAGADLAYDACCDKLREAVGKILG